MEGVGPISIEVTKLLTEKASSMYRVLTDPISNQPHDMALDRYRITKAMRTMLRIRDEYCQFPGCMAKAATSEVDHIVKFQSGGTTTFDNVESLCLHHHLPSHFKDDKTRAGEYRPDQFPERAATRLRGWTPCITDSGVAWTSPAGRFYPPEPLDNQPLAYPKWLKKLIDHRMLQQYLEDKQSVLDYQDRAGDEYPVPELDEYSDGTNRQATPAGNYPDSVE
ncbi:hypothetical protein MB46_16055 [Arthrobacter alpinus]|nr:hypothetical protein MB46_16055 [Arthrobacter alpinus]